jgi:phosphatidylserine/phosphatidylglycerophosphate/cardiolipin synthase-like enzyme
MPPDRDARSRFSDHVARAARTDKALPSAAMPNRLPLALAMVVAATSCTHDPAASAPHAPARPAAAIAAEPPAAPGFELVETAPIETVLDHRDIPDAADVWLAMIEGARRSVDLAEFYASNHQPSRLEPVIAAIEAAIARGVRVRFLAEHGFVATYPETLDRLARAGATVREIDLRGVAGAGGILHAKYFIVDERDAFFGSQNFDWRALEHNYELGARVRDPAVVGGLAAIFAADWARAGGEPAPAIRVPAARGPIELVASPPACNPPGIAWDLPRIVSLIDAATATITVEALSYHAGEWDELEAPLVGAAQRGVEVQLLFADWTKRPKTITGLQRLARLPHLAVRLTTIPPWSGGFVPFARVTHAKALVVDGKRAWLGTSNWEKEYFYGSRNVGVIIEDAALAGQLAGFFATLWQSPYAIAVDPDAHYTPPRIE